MARYVQGVVNVSPPLGSPPGWRYINMDSTLINNDRVFIDVTNGNIDLILPPTPVNASTIIISHVAGDITDNNVVVHALNTQINDYDLLILDRPYKSIELIYSQTANRWIILHDSIQNLKNSIIINNDFTAESDDFIYVDTTLTTIEITLPANPLIGMSITVADKCNTFDVNNCIINGNSNKILARSDRLFLDSPSTLVKLTFWNASEGWHIFNIYANKWMALSDNIFENINGVPYYIITSVSNLENNQIYFVNTTNGGFTGKLPVTSNPGDVITIVDKTGTFNTHNFVLDYNSTLIEGLAENLYLDINNSITKFVYIGADQGWVVFNLTISSNSFIPDMLTSDISFNYYVVVDDQILSNNDFIFIDTTSNPIALTLSASPVPGERVVICDISPTFINACSINSGTHTINNLDNTLVLDSNNNSIILIYDGVNNWGLYYLTEHVSDVIPDINQPLLLNNNKVSVLSNRPLVNKDFALVNTTNTPIIVTLPSTPNLGDTISILDAYGTFSINNCMVNPNGSKISNDPTSLILDIDKQYVTLIYVNSTFGWYVW